MLQLDAATLARLSSACGECYLIELDFTGGTLRYTTWGDTLTAVVDGVSSTYIGLGAALAVSALKESADTAADQLTVSLSLANASTLSAALGAVETYRNRPMRIYLQLLDERGVIDGTAVRRFTGVMDKVGVAVEADSSTGQHTGRVDLFCSRRGMARVRHAEGERLSHEQQAQRFPGDRGLEFLTEMINKPRTWLSVAFQRQ